MDPLWPQCGRKVWRNCNKFVARDTHLYCADIRWAYHIEHRDNDIAFVIVEAGRELVWPWRLLYALDEWQHADMCKDRCRDDFMPEKIDYR